MRAQFSSPTPTATLAALASGGGAVHVWFMRRRDLLIRLGLVAGAVGGAWWVRDHVVWRRPTASFADGPTDWLPYAEARATTPTLALRVNGQPVRALVDSGAQYSAVDRSLVQRLGLTNLFDIPMVAYGVGGGAQMGRGATLDVTIGAGDDGLRLDGLRAAILDLGPLAGEAGLGAGLILGQDVLAELVLELDTQARRLRFAPRAGWTAPSALTALPVRRAGRALETAITVEGATLEAVVDTGASALLALTRDTAQGVGLLDGRERRAGRSIVLGGVIQAETVRVRTLTIGDELYRRAEVAIYDDVPVPGFPRALVGMAAFAERRMAMDLGRPGLWAARPLELTVEP